MTADDHRNRPRRREPLVAEREEPGTTTSVVDQVPPPPDPTLVEEPPDLDAAALADRLLLDPEEAPPVSPGAAAKGLAGASWGPLAILFGLNLVDELDRTAFSVLAPEIRDDFGLSISGITAIVGVVGIVAVLLQLVVGFYADRYPRVRLALAGASVWALFTLTTGVAPGLIVLGVARVGSAIGKLVNDPTHRSLLADYYPPEARGYAYYLHTAANSAGIVLAPVLAGGLASVLGWRTPFILFAVPTAVLVAAGVARLREPVRGAHERREAGGSEQAIGLEEEPPSFGEAWRAVHQVQTLRRVLYSLPFLSAAFSGFVILLSQFYEQRFDLEPFEIGLLFSVVNVAQFAALGLLIRRSTTYLATDPKRIFLLVALAGPVAVLGYIGTSMAGSVAVSAAFLCVLAASVAPMLGGVPLVMSIVIPPRVRSLGFSVGSVYTLPGFVLVFWIAHLAETRSFTYAFVVMAPFLLLGAGILASGGAFVAADMARVRASALARAEAILSRERGEAKLLVARGVDVKYGATQVLFGVDLEIDDGEIVALLGTNGAGKSTFLNAVTGLVDPSAGAIVFDGRDITNLPAEEATALGIVMVPGGKGVFPTLTVRENMELAGWLFDKDPEHVARATETVLEYFPILRQRWDEKAGNMSGGEQQMLTLGQAFIARPRLLLIDELSLGLAPVIVEQLLGIVRAIHAQGTTIVLVEQSVNVACTVAERAVFMEKGEVRFDGPTAELLERPDVLRAVFLQGTGAADRPQLIDREVRALRLEHAPVALQTHGLSVSFGGIRAVDDVDLSVRQGEILGLIGPNGAGKTTIMDLVSGFLVPTSGRVLLHGTDVTELTPDARAMLGLGRSFQDARLFPSLTVREALAVALERHITTKDPLAAALGSPATRASERQVSARVDELLEMLNLGAFANKFVGELSTGSRRVVDLACVVAHQPSVLLLDEPSSGIAQRETEALGPLLLEIRERTGAALVVIEHDMPLIQGISDRLLALELGAVVVEGPPQEVIEHPRVVEAYLGGSDAVINRSGGGTQ
ncbi:MAG TPA: MFS transporter [Acidimicrobiales bacterium]|nr:MFS transporter [Acidimicrobiales bacterium]